MTQTEAPANKMSEAVRVWLLSSFRVSKALECRDVDVFEMPWLVSVKASLPYNAIAWAGGVRHPTDMNGNSIYKLGQEQ
jgi:hypothetical protein